MLGILRKIINSLQYRRAKRIISENATLIGNHHHISTNSRIYLKDGAQKKNVILENNCLIKERNIMGKYNSSIHRVRPLMECIRDDFCLFEKVLKSHHNLHTQFYRYGRS